MTIKFLIIGIGTLIASLSWACNEEFAYGLLAIKNSQFLEARKLLLDSNQRQPLNSQQMFIILITFDSDLTPKNINEFFTEEIIDLYLKATNALAKNNLGYLKQNGYGMKRDNKEAMHLYKLAADQGNVIAQINLGSMYEQGFSIENDFDFNKGLHYYRLAAHQGNEVAKQIVLKLDRQISDLPQKYVSDRKYKFLAKKIITVAELLKDDATTAEACQRFAEFQRERDEFIEKTSDVFHVRNLRITQEDEKYLIHFCKNTELDGKVPTRKEAENTAKHLSKVFGYQ